MNGAIKNLLLVLAVAAFVRPLQAEEFADAPGVYAAGSDGASETAVYMVDSPESFRKLQRRLVDEAQNAGASVERQIFSEEPFQDLPEEDRKPLPLAEPKPNLIESVRRPNIAATNALTPEQQKEIKAIKRERFMVTVRRVVGVGGLTSLTMGVGALKSGDPMTVAVAATIGLVVGGGYSAALQAKAEAVQRFIKYRITDPKKESGIIGKTVKQMAIPVGLALLTASAKIVADRCGVNFDTMLEQHAGKSALDVLKLASTSAYFQLPWGLENKEKFDEEMKEAGNDPVKQERARLANDKRTATLALGLAVANSAQLSGIKMIGPITAGIVGTTGAIKRLFKYTTPQPAEESSREIASLEKPKEGESPWAKALTMGRCAFNRLRGSTGSASARSIASVQEASLTR